MKFNIRIQLARLNMTRAELARRLGVSTPTIARLADGTSTGVNLNKLERLCKELKCTPNDIIFVGDRSITEINASSPR